MDVRLDDEDEFGEEDFEDDIIDAEVVDVEEELPPKEPHEEPAKIPPAAPPPKAKRPGVKKALIVIAVIVLVIVASLVVYIYMPRAPSGITLLNPKDTTEGLSLEVAISSDSATQSSGTAKITISFNGSTVYTNDNWKIKSNKAVITIPYDQFVMDNGVYTIFTEFEGVSDEVTYEIDFVLKHLLLTIIDNVFVGNQAQFTLNVGVSGEGDGVLKDSEIMISSIDHEDGIHSVTSGIGDWQDMAGLAEYTTTLYYQLSGNYTFTIDVENNDVKDSSDYASFSIETVKLINAPPVAKFLWDWDDNDGDGEIDQGDEVTFFGDTSVDEGDLDYKWEITFSTSATSPGNVVWTDEGDETTYTFNNYGYYGITLLVTDQFGIFNSKNQKITVSIG